MGGISSSELKTLNAADYAGTDLIGKVSLEHNYETDLHGDVGHADVLVNARGRTMQTLGSEPSVPGKDLILTLDIEAQVAAHAALGNRRGAVVAIDPKTGEILVLASTPAFDPNAISAGMSRDEYDALQNDPDLPLFNRALRGTYPPGSTIKPILALAALHYETLDPDHRMRCSGHYTLPGKSHRYRDWKSHGLVNMKSSVEESCDVYFYAMAMELGIDRMEGFPATQFGLGCQGGDRYCRRETGPRAFQGMENAPHLPIAEDQVWYPGETVITGYRAGLSADDAAATRARHGNHRQPGRDASRPTLLRGFVDPVSGIAEYFDPKPMDSGRRNQRRDSGIESVDAMRAVLQGRDGTARAAGLQTHRFQDGRQRAAPPRYFPFAQDEEYDAEEIEERKRDHALFVAFAPGRGPPGSPLPSSSKMAKAAAAPQRRSPGKVMETYLQGATP